MALENPSLLKNYFQGLEITNEIHNDYPEIVWRIVRPNEKSDVGPLHTDKWFWDINKWQIPSKKKCIKVWIMIGGEENKSGLRVMPHSQKKTTWDFQVKKKSNIYKPVLDEKKQDIITDVIPTKPGKAIIFSYDLLHGGVITKGDKCRVSMEFTIFTEEWI